MGNLSKSLRFEVLTRDGFRCRYCGATAQDARLHIDHVEPRAKGGSDDLENLVAACADCNHGKGDRQIIPTPSGLTLSPDQRPARMAQMRAVKSGGHELDCCNIEEWDEINDDLQLVWIWCRIHKKLEWHSVPLWRLEEGGFHRTDRKPVEW